MHPPPRKADSDDLCERFLAQTRTIEPLRVRLSNKFTLWLYKSFDLKSCAWVATTDANVGEDDDVAIDIALPEHPILRHPGPLLKYLQRCEKLGKFKDGLLYGLLEGPTMCHHHAT